MKTPSQTAEYLKQREDKEATKALKEREKHLQSIRTELTDIVNRAIDEGTVTEKGGKINYPYFKGGDKEEGLKDVKEIFRESGWSCQYRPQEDSSYSMTSRSESYFTVHYFYLAPLKKVGRAKEGDKLTTKIDAQFKDTKIRPLSDEERRKVEARIKKRLRPYTMKRRPSLDDFTPM